MPPKKVRSTNFKTEEEHQLVQLVLKRKNVIESKASDMQTKRAKDTAWELITNEFNAACPLSIRSLQVLREKYKNIKRNLRKYAATKRAGRMATGGGKPPAEFEIKSEAITEEDSISMSVFGLESRYDDDHISGEAIEANEAKEELLRQTSAERRDMHEAQMGEHRLRMEQLADVRSQSLAEHTLRLAILKAELRAAEAKALLAEKSLLEF